MTVLTPLFALTALLLALLASVAIWAPRRLPVKLVALFGAFLTLPLSYAAMAGLLSKPKPVALEWWLQQTEEATVLASSLREGEGIFLWLQLGGIDEPRAYVIPWDQKLAEQLQAAGREAESNQGGVRMRMPFEPSLDDREPRFYALPQPAGPPKDGELPPAELYQHPGTEA
jgi:hypothetical protein